MNRRRVVRILLGCYSLASVLAGFGALWIAQFRCDDTCHPRSNSWLDHADAWQWQSFVGAVGTSGLLALLVAVGLLYPERVSDRLLKIGAAGVLVLQAVAGILVGSA